ncbi:hypothetical protein [Pseudactinotalea sp. Z1748]|uniref:hypothetical protein n=1 Tax=Pseudactinotalea sp. Z1748 TaxID=3413027 RepID=UPI003C7AF993
MMHPLAHCDRDRDDLLALMWGMVLDLARHTGRDPVVVALSRGLIPTARKP